MAALIAVVASVAQRVREVVPPAPTPSPPVTMRVIQSAPADQALIWFGPSQSGVPFTMRATDWRGKVVGSVSVTCQPCGVLASPDGQRLLVGYQTGPGLSPDSDRVFDARGRLLALVDGFQSVWSDDSRHLCEVRPAHGNGAGGQPPGAATAELRMVDTTDGAVRSVSILDTTVSIGTVGGGFWFVASCSSRSDRATVVYMNGEVQAVRVLALSSGRTLLGRDASASPGLYSSVVVSEDGRVAAENADSGAVTRLDLVTGRESQTPAPWTGRGPVTALSWDGALAVTPLGVYSFPSGRAVWQAQLPSYMEPLSSDPTSSAVLLSLWLASESEGRPVIVRADGSETRLPNTYLSQPPLPF